MIRKKLIDKSKCAGCRNCELACIAIHSNTSTGAAYAFGIGNVECSRNKVEADGNGNKFPQFCRHCDEPACVEACMSGALKKLDDGLVVCDENICVGCFMCVMSCPYGMARPSLVNGHKMIKCDGCRDLDHMACVKACPQKCITEIFDDTPTGGHIKFKQGEDL